VSEGRDNPLTEQKWETRSVSDDDMNCCCAMLY
jgi:hypothetical protein